MKKVLFVITKSNFGGAQRYVYELATQLPKDQFEVHVALGGNGILKNMLEEAGIPVYPLTHAERDINLIKEAQLLVRLFSIIRKIKPQIVHLNSPKIGGLGAVAARLNRVDKIIYTNHGWPFKEERPLWQITLIKFFSWLTVFLGKQTIVLSEMEQNIVSNWLFIQNKIILIPNGLVSFDPLPKKDALAFLIGQSKTDQVYEESYKVIGTISELHKNKGLSYALQGIARYIKHTQDKVIFICIGEGERRASLEQEIESLGLTGQVYLVGHFENARNYLSAFDYFLLSSIKEGLPYCILEAGSLGVPVITTNVGGIPEVVTNLKEGFLITPRKPREIKQALLYINEHPEETKIYAKNLKEKIKTKYSFDAMLHKIKELYTS